MTDGVRHRSLREMPTFDQRVQRRHQLPARRWREQRCVVADAQRHIAADPRQRRGWFAEVALDQFELAHGQDLIRGETRASVLVRPQLARGLVHHCIDELVAIGGAEALRQRHGFADSDAEGNIRMRAQFDQADQ